MSDPSKPKLPGSGEEVSVEKRMLLAFALVGVVLLLSQFLFSPKAPQNTGAKQVKPAEVSEAKPPAGSPPAPSPAVATPAAEGQTGASTEQLTTVDTKVYRIVFSNKGAVVKSWQLKDYKDSSGKPLELVNDKASEKTWYPLSLIFESQKPSTDLNLVYYAPTVTDGGLGVKFEYSNGKSRGFKSLRFARDSYLFDIVSEVSENGAGIPHMLAWRGGFGDRTAYAAAATMKTLFFNTSENKLVEQEAKIAKDGPVISSGNYSFAGIEDTYFLGVFLPRDRHSVKVQTLSDSVQLHPTGGNETVIGVGVGGEVRNDATVYVGPKDIDLLRRVNPKLEGAVDFGWFAFIAKPIFLALNWLDSKVGNYGWSIILLTLAINMLLLPLKLSGMKGMKKMSALQPEIQKINDRYRNISLTDPRKAQQNEEIMALYKKHGVNPLGAGCFPLLLQIPFFFAFYKVLSVAIELRGADWLWVHDLSHFDPLYVLPVIMVVTQFVLQRMTPNTTADPAQQKMMMFMPLMFGIMFFKASAGLVLYWLTGNVVSIAQQVLINRITPAPAVVSTSPAKQPAKTKTRK